MLSHQPNSNDLAMGPHEPWPPSAPHLAAPSLAERYPSRAVRWQLKSRALTFGSCPLLMGIVNVTPDSFSDGGRYHSTKRAVAHAIELVAEGADLIDIGGESTRPYAAVVEVAEELRRVVAVVAEVCAKVSVPVSVDTSKSAVARACLDAGAEIINDVTGLEGDPEMLEVARQTQAAVCVMHMQGNPQTMQVNPAYENVVAEIGQYLRQRRDFLLASGIQADKICLDPGIGFGKSHEHNLTLMAECDRYHPLGCPLLVGHSRKGFLGKILRDHEQDRTLATVGAALALASRGVQILRIHDVRPVREALAAYLAVGGVDGRAITLP